MGELENLSKNFETVGRLYSLQDESFQNGYQQGEAYGTTLGVRLGVIMTLECGGKKFGSKYAHKLGEEMAKRHGDKLLGGASE